MPGIYETRSYPHILAMIKEELKLEGTNQHDGYLVRHIDLKTRNIGDLGSQYATHCILDIVDGKAKLPPHLTEVLGFKFVGADCAPGLFLNRRYLGACNCDLIGPSYTSTASIEEDYIVFHTPQNIDSNQISLTYMRRRTNEQGLALVSSVAESAAIFGVCADWHRREKDLALSREYALLYRAACESTRALFARRDFAENRREIIAVMNRWVNNDENLINTI